MASKKKVTKVARKVAKRQRIYSGSPDAKQRARSIIEGRKDKAKTKKKTAVRNTKAKVKSRLKGRGISLDKQSLTNRATTIVNKRKRPTGVTKKTRTVARIAAQ